MPGYLYKVGPIPLRVDVSTGQRFFVFNKERVGRKGVAAIRIPAPAWLALPCMWVNQIYSRMTRKRLK